MDKYLPHSGIPQSTRLAAGTQRRSYLDGNYGLYQKPDQHTFVSAVENSRTLLVDGELGAAALVIFVRNVLNKSSHNRRDAMSEQESKCPDCGGRFAAHRGGCPRSDSPTDPLWSTCDCGNRIWLLPIANYTVDGWGSCHTSGLCKECPLHDVDKLFKRIGPYSKSDGRHE